MTQPITWKGIIDDMTDAGFIVPDDSIMKDEEMTYSDYFKKEYISQSIGYIVSMYSILFPYGKDTTDDFSEELLKGNVFLVEGNLIHKDLL